MPAPTITDADLLADAQQTLDLIRRMDERIVAHRDAADRLIRAAKELDRWFEEAHRIRIQHRSAVLTRWRLRQEVRSKQLQQAAALGAHQRTVAALTRWSQRLVFDAEQISAHLLAATKTTEEYKALTGIYALVREGTIVYIGQSINVHNRLAQHCQDRGKRFDRVCVIPTPRHLLDRRERLLIAVLRPIYNKTRYEAPELLGDVSPPAPPPH